MLAAVGSTPKFTNSHCLSFHNLNELPIVEAMKCPICVDEVLDEKHSHGIEVDVCPRCNGVWLNHGELEKLAAQSVPTMRQYQPRDVLDNPVEDKRSSDDAAERKAWKSDRRRSERDDDDDDDDPKLKSKKMSFGEMLEEIFDELLDLDDIFDWD